METAPWPRPPRRRLPNYSQCVYTRCHKTRADCANQTPEPEDGEDEDEDEDGDGEAEDDDGTCGASRARDVD